MNPIRSALISGVAAACLGVGTASLGAAPCDRTCLVSLTERYVTSLTAHDAAALPWTPNARITENSAPLKPGEGLWKTATTLVARRELFADLVNGQTAFWGVFDEGGTPAILHARLKVQDGRIAELETIVARRGSHALFAPDTFARPVPMFDAPLKPEERVSRARLIEAANGYFEGLEQHNNRLVSSADVCNRYENGVLMTNRPGTPPTPRACAMAVDRLFQIKRVFDRRFGVVDEERGVVMSTIMFDIPADAAATPPREARMLLLAELFKVVRGEIVRIETVMHNLPYGAVSGWAAQ
jgi:hypothetical protein